MAINNFIPTVWSESLLKSLDQSYIGASNCNREFEGEIKEKGNSVRICGIDNVTVGYYQKNLQINAPQQLSDKSALLSIDQARYFNFLIDDVDRAQAMPNLMDAALKNAANAIAQAADSYIYSQYLNAGHRIEAAFDGDEIIKKIMEARTRILCSGVSDPKDIVIELHPLVANKIMKSLLSLSSDNTEVLETGCIGSLFGSKVFVSPNVYVEALIDTSTVHCLVRTKRAIAYAEQLSEVEAYRPELRFADAVKGLHLFGAKVVYPLEIASIDITYDHSTMYEA